MKLTSSQAIVKYLISEGVPYVLGIFGHGNLQLGEALKENEGKITYVQVKNEQNAVHIAAAYAKMTGRPLAVTTSIGPGCTNLVTGAAGARVNRLPVLLLPGDAFADGVGPVLQQIEGNFAAEEMASDTLRPVSKYWVRIARPEQLRRRLREAFDAMLEPGNQGPATICLPMDSQAFSFDYDLKTLLAPRDKNWERIAPDDRAVQRAVKLISKAKRPIIIAGGGVIRSEAWDEVQDLVEDMCIPVVHTHAGNGALLWDHPLNLFGAGCHGTSCGNEIAKKADLVIGIGTRYQDFPVASETLYRNAKHFININICHVDIGKERAVKVYGDAKVALEMILEELRGKKKYKNYRQNPYYREIKEARDKWLKEAERLYNLGASPMAQSEIIGVITDFATRDAVVISAAGSLPGDLLKLWKCKDPKRKGYHIEFGYSCMGYEIAAGMGVRLADKERDIYVMVGDASFLMASQEIVTMAQEGLEVTIVVVDNLGPQCIRYLQVGNKLQDFGNEFRYRRGKKLIGPYMSTNFAKLGEGMGARGLRAENKKELKEALERAKAVKNKPAVIHVLAHPDIGVPGYGGWWDVPIPEVSKRKELQKKLREYQAMKKKQIIR